jgi:hypothetical protein
MNIYSEEGDLCHDMINRRELSGFDPFADAFSDVRIQSTDLPEEAGDRVRALSSAGLHLKLCPPTDVKQFTSGVKAHVRRKARAIVGGDELNRYRGHDHD